MQKTADIVVLVVDCDDLVMEQTKEAIKHIKNNVELQTPEKPQMPPVVGSCNV